MASPLPEASKNTEQIRIVVTNFCTYPCPPIMTPLLVNANDPVKEIRNKIVETYKYDAENISISHKSMKTLTKEDEEKLIKDFIPPTFFCK